MAEIDYDGRCFVGIVNYDDGDLTSETVFQYRQHNQVVWGTYEGGGVAFGTLIGVVDTSGHINMRWQHVNREGGFVGGTCYSIPERLSDGRLRLLENWRVTEGEQRKGTSVVEEVTGRAGGDARAAND